MKREKFLKTPTGFKLPKSLRLCLTPILNEFPNTENFVFHLFFVALLTCNILSSRSQKLYLQWGGCYKTDLTSMHLYFNVTKTGHQVSGIQMFPLTVFIHLLLNQRELAFSLQAFCFLFLLFFYCRCAQVRSVK